MQYENVKTTNHRTVIVLFAIIIHAQVPVMDLKQIETMWREKEKI